MNVPLTITVRVRRWVPWYLEAVGVFATAFGLEPDYERVGAFIARYGLKVST